MTLDPSALRAAEFPWADGVTYLNAASIGPLPERSRRVLETWARKRTTPHELPDPVLFATMAEARERAARLLNAEPAEIALATNTSFGLNVAALALPLRPGDIVVASDREFPANVYPWMRLAERGVTLELAPTTPEGWPDEDALVARLDDPRVRVLAISLVQFANGYACDLARLSAATRARGAFLVVDAIQGLGQLPVDVRATPVDILACGAQKWLLSPWGAGFAYVRRELVPALTPPLAGWTAFEGTDDYSRLCDYDDTWRADARRFEVITLPVQDLAAMNASLALIEELGVEAIRAHVLGVSAPLHAWAARRGLPLASPTGARQSGITCVRVPDGARLHRALREAGIICSLREGALRFSPHCYSRAEELERVTELLDRLL